MKLQIEIDLDESIPRAFDQPSQDEAARILRHLADNLDSLWSLEYLRYLHRREIHAPPPAWIVKDVNRKAVGHAQIKSGIDS